MNFIKLFKDKIIKVLGKFFYKEKYEKFPIFYIKGSQTLPPPLDIVEEES